MHIGGALVKAIARLAAPAGVAGGQTGATAVCETGAVEGVGELVVETGTVVVVVLVVVCSRGAAAGLELLERRAIRPTTIPTTTSAEIERRAVRRRRLRCST